MFEATSISALCAAVVVAGLGVAACAESTSDGTAAAAPAPARPAAGGRTNDLPPPPPPVVASAPALSVEKARAECWMKLETDKKAPKDLDKRVKLVEACVAQKMSAPPTTKEP